MSTGTAKAGPPANPTAAGTSAPLVERERYIERQLRKTRQQVRGVELTSRLMLLAAAAVAFFLVAAVFDHWLVPGGLSIYGRLAFLVVFLIGAGWFAARELAPLFVYRINPLFAAQTIERAKPTLKNSLLNFLMLRSHRGAVPEVVLSAVEEQAAANLQRTPIEHVVDRTRLVQIGYLLLAIVAAYCTYYLISPKSPLQTVGRVVLPWADLQAPSRIEIGEIEPGTTTVFRGERVTVSAAVRGPLKEDEAVTLYFSTADRQSVDQPLRMYVAKDSYGRHAVTLPPQADAAALSVASAGLQQDIEYYIEAGDAKSRTYRLSVIQAPNIVVEKLVYAYPEYTRLAPETVEKSGDIRAVEGTQVTIHALANQPIASAYLDLGGDGSHKQPMKTGGQRATTTVTLALNEERTAPLYSHYRVRFVNDGGHENREPIRYRIDVTPDPAPELELLKPDKVETAVALDAPIQFEVDATDSLYGLSDVRIIANVDGEPAFRRNRTIGKDDESAARLVHKHVERLDRITLDGGKKLKPGDVIEYWAEAVDNKTPKPNVTMTDVRRLVIVEPQRGQNPNQKPQPNDQGEGQAEENQQDGDRQDQNNQQQNQRGDNNNKAGDNDDQNGEERRQPNDQQRQPGDNDQPRRGDQPQANEPNQDKRGERNEQQRPENDPEAERQKDDQNKAEKPGEPRDDQKNAAGDAKQNQQAKGQEGAKGDGRNQRSGDQADNQRGDPSQDGATGEQQKGSGNQSNGAQGNAGGQGAPQHDQSQPPVDKSDEGEALNRILKHAEEKGGKTPDQSSGQQDEQRPTTDHPATEQDKSDKSYDGLPRPSPRGDRQNPPGADQSNNTRDQKTNKQTGEKSGAQTKNDGGRKAPQPQPAPEENQDQGTKSGEAQSDQTKQGKRGDEKGGSTPAPQEQVRPDNDRPTTDSANARSDQQEKSPAHGRNDSKTKGQNSGDRSGRGKDGGGKNDNRAGSGAKGASDPANEGRDAAKEPGAGETGDKSGEDKTASGKTGKSGAEKGDGSKSQPAAGSKEQTDEQRNATDRDADVRKDGPGDAAQQQQPGDGAKETQAGGDTEQQQPADQAGRKDSKNGNQKESDNDAQARDQQSGDKTGDGNAKTGPPKPGSTGKGSPTGGGGTPTGDLAEPPDVPRVEPTDDTANLEYARRATDLALVHLRNQLKDGRPDQDLLDRLGWSKDDLQKLLSRWEKMEREAKQPGPKGAKAKQNLQEALKSLGWQRPGQTTRKANTKGDDTARGLRDAARSAPPPEYADEFRAFQRSTSRAEK